VSLWHGHLSTYTLVLSAAIISGMISVRRPLTEAMTHYSLWCRLYSIVILFTLNSVVKPPYASCKLGKMFALVVEGGVVIWNGFYSVD
jgi:hypothetical protein